MAFCASRRLRGILAKQIHVPGVGFEDEVKCVPQEGHGTGRDVEQAVENHPCNDDLRELELEGAKQKNETQNSTDDVACAWY